MARTRRLSGKNISELNYFLGNLFVSHLKSRTFDDKKEAVDKVEPNLNEHVGEAGTEFRIGQPKPETAYSTFLRVYRREGGSLLYISLTISPPKVKGNIEKLLKQELPKETEFLKSREVSREDGAVHVEYRMAKLPSDDERRTFGYEAIDVWKKIMRNLV